MSDPISLSLGQQFEVERMNRAIESTFDPPQLQAIAKQLLMAWQTQKAATQWMVKQQLGTPGAVSSQALANLQEPGERAS